jgi:hypothetical protein
VPSLRGGCVDGFAGAVAQRPAPLAAQLAGTGDFGY